jgi:dynein intermediate chain 2
VGGSINGMISVYDLRQSNEKSERNNIPIIVPQAISQIALSHHEPVSDICWVKAKHSFMCVSTSTDGQILWWDTRDLEKPTDSINTGEKRLTSMEYHQDLATKFLLSSEDGEVMLLNMRNRKQESGGLSCFTTSQQKNIAHPVQIPGQHQSSIYCLQRNPIHNKYFLTVGDTEAKIWTEDIKSPIWSMPYHENYLTGGCWSSTRPGVFFVTRTDGVVDVWDLNGQQKDAVWSHKLGNNSISAIGVQYNSDAPSTDNHGSSKGDLAALGDTNGSVHLIELGCALSTLQLTEKNDISMLFELELKREKNNESQEKDSQKVNAQEKNEVSSIKKKEEKESIKNTEMVDKWKDVEETVLESAGTKYEYDCDSEDGDSINDDPGA